MSIFSNMYVPMKISMISTNHLKEKNMIIICMREVLVAPLTKTIATFLGIHLPTLTANSESRSWAWLRGIPGTTTSSMTFSVAILWKYFSIFSNFRYHKHY